MQTRRMKFRVASAGEGEYCTFTIAEAPIQPGKLDHVHILTPKQVAQRLQVGISFIYENTRKRAGIRNPDPLPSIRMGKYLRFYWPEVEKWLARKQVGQNNA